MFLFKTLSKQPDKIFDFTSCKFDKMIKIDLKRAKKANLCVYIHSNTENEHQAANYAKHKVNYMFNVKNFMVYIDNLLIFNSNFLSVFNISFIFTNNHQIYEILCT